MDTNYKNVFIKTVCCGLVWPFLFSVSLYKFVEHPQEMLYFFGGLISLPVAFMFGLDGYGLIKLCALPGIIIIFFPYLFFLAKHSEYKAIYICCSLFSFLSSIIGAIIIIGKYY